MPAGQQVLNGAGVKQPGFVNTPRESLASGVSCLYDDKTCNVSSLASIWLDAAPIGEDSLHNVSALTSEWLDAAPIAKKSWHAAETAGSAAWLGSMSNNAKNSNAKKNSPAFGKKKPAKEPVSDLRSALRAQGNQLMQELAMPKSASVPCSNQMQMCQWQESLCMTIPKDMMSSPSIRPPPGLEDYVTSYGPPGMLHSMDPMETMSWTAKTPVAGDAAYPCLLRTSSARQKQDEPWFLL
eukprot:TRINITY_DN14791_c0_g1_i1.p1 TRINITY_DN14791_c0_g1~~TRINITY_DN14791_c0_g1_i1.p1  ORF type:complete len:239 (-),score=48.74 TRINITY_DN14791_c0_g1_i1:283-999(-)